jgi:hypothetical protein
MARKTSKKLKLGEDSSIRASREMHDGQSTFTKTTRLTKGVQRADLRRCRAQRGEREEISMKASLDPNLDRKRRAAWMPAS